MRANTHHSQMGNKEFPKKNIVFLKKKEYSYKRALINLSYETIVDSLNLTIGTFLTCSCFLIKSLNALSLSHSITESSLFLTQSLKAALTCSLFLTCRGLRHRSITLAGTSRLFTHPRRKLR